MHQQEAAETCSKRTDQPRVLFGPRSHLLPIPVDPRVEGPLSRTNWLLGVRLISASVITVMTA